MFEPIQYYENIDESHDCVAKRRISAQYSYVTDASCATKPLCQSSLFALACKDRNFEKIARRKTYNGKPDLWRRLLNINKGAGFARIHRFWPRFSFAHFPRLIDREHLELFADHDFLDLTAATRRIRDRDGTDGSLSLWTTWLISYFSIAQQQAVDWPLEQRFSGWTRPHPSQLSSIEHLYGPLSLALLAELQPFPNASRLRSNGASLEGSHLDVEPWSGTSLLEEKMNYVAVRLDRKPMIYYFCMLRSISGIYRCLRETVGSSTSTAQRKNQLFVTVNDDFVGLGPYDRAHGRLQWELQQLLDRLAGGETDAPWERRYRVLGQ
jgi:hypothetical protein